jgi:hypothetical protein
MTLPEQLGVAAPPAGARGGDLTGIVTACPAEVGGRGLRVFCGGLSLAPTATPFDSFPCLRAQLLEDEPRAGLATCAICGLLFEWSRGWTPIPWEVPT